METRQFRAKSMAEALRETRRVLGPDALIVSARTMDSRSGMVEVTAVGGRQEQPKQAAGPKAAAAPSTSPTDDIADPEPWNKSIEPLREDLVSLRRMVYELRRVADEAILPGFNDLRTLILESSRSRRRGGCWGRSIRSW